MTRSVGYIALILAMSRGGGRCFLLVGLECTGVEAGLGRRPACRSGGKCDNLALPGPYGVSGYTDGEGYADRTGEGHRSVSLVV